MREVDIASVYLDATNLDRSRSSIPIKYLANHISESDYFDNVSWNFGTNGRGQTIQGQRSHGGTNSIGYSVPIFMTNTGIRPQYGMSD